MYEVDKYSRIPIYEQVITMTEKMIADGELRENDMVPSVRVMSQELSVNPNTLQKAYAELERRGLCYSVPGSGRFIAVGAQKLVFGNREKLMKDLSGLCEELKRCKVKLDEVVDAVRMAYEIGGAK